MIIGSRDDTSVQIERTPVNACSSLLSQRLTATLQLPLPALIQVPPHNPTHFYQDPALPEFSFLPQFLDCLEQQFCVMVDQAKSDEEKQCRVIRTRLCTQGVGLSGDSCTQYLYM